MRKILKGVIVLLIAIAMVFSTVAIADTQTKETTPELYTTGNGSANGARDSVVWDNGMEYSGLMSSQWDESYPYDCYQADDFHFEEPTEVTDVHWVGGYWNPKENGGFDWCIQFFKDDGSGGAPAALPYQPSYAGPFCFTVNEYTEEYLDETETSLFYEYSVDLPEPITFNACEKYWIAIWGAGVFPPQSGWGFHEDFQLSPCVWGSDFWGYVYWTPGYDIQGYDHDMAFQLTGPSPCEPCIDVEKYVWDTWNQEWVDADTEDEALDVKICKEVSFKIVIHNCGNEPLYEIVVKDKMHNSLKFISSDPEGESYYEEPFWYINWFFNGPLDPCETIEIYITAHVEGPECSYDFNYVLVEAYGCGEIVRDEDYAWVHAHDRAREFNSPILNFLETHPNMFPLLQILLERLGLF
jgi:hypothetical protein